MTMNESNTVAVNDVEQTAAQLLMRALYDEITNIRVPWSITPEDQQQAILDRLRGVVDLAVRGAVRSIATVGFTSIRGRVDSLTIKDDAKAVLLLARGSEQIHDLADHVSSEAILVFADPQQFIDGMQVFKAQADQPALPLGDD